MSKSLSGPVKNSITGKTNKVVIFFHGYGADGNDLISSLMGILLKDK